MTLGPGLIASNHCSGKWLSPPGSNASKLSPQKCQTWLPKSVKPDPPKAGIHNEITLENCLFCVKSGPQKVQNMVPKKCKICSRKMQNLVPRKIQPRHRVGHLLIGLGVVNTLSCVGMLLCLKCVLFFAGLDALVCCELVLGFVAELCAPHLLFTA